MRLEGWGPEEQAPHPPGDVPEPAGGGGYSSSEGGRSGRDGRKGEVTGRGRADQSQGVSREVRNGPQHPRAKAAPPPCPRTAHADRHMAWQQRGSYHHQPG